MGKAVSMRSNGRAGIKPGEPEPKACARSPCHGTTGAQTAPANRALLPEMTGCLNEGEFSVPGQGRLPTPMSGRINQLISFLLTRLWFPKTNLLGEN